MGLETLHQSQTGRFPHPLLLEGLLVDHDQGAQLQVRLETLGHGQGLAVLHVAQEQEHFADLFLDGWTEGLEDRVPVEVEQSVHLGDDELHGVDTLLSHE